MPSSPRKQHFKRHGSCASACQGSLDAHNDAVGRQPKHRLVAARRQVAGKSAPRDAAGRSAEYSRRSALGVRSQGTERTQHPCDITRCRLRPLPAPGCTSRRCRDPAPPAAQMRKCGHGGQTSFGRVRQAYTDEDWIIGGPWADGGSISPRAPNHRPSSSVLSWRTRPEARLTTSVRPHRRTCAFERQECGITTPTTGTSGSGRGSRGLQRVMSHGCCVRSVP